MGAAENDATFAAVALELLDEFADTLLETLSYEPTGFDAATQKRTGATAGKSVTVRVAPFAGQTMYGEVLNQPGSAQPARFVTYVDGAEIRAADATFRVVPGVKVTRDARVYTVTDVTPLYSGHLAAAYELIVQAAAHPDPPAT